MDKQALVDQINTISSEIKNLELQEERYISMLQIPTNGPGVGKIFSISVGMQPTRCKLAAVREKIYAQGVEHCKIIASLRQIDNDLACKLNYPFFHNMLIRLTQLRFENSAYVAHQDALPHALVDRNKDHASYNSGLITRITNFFDYYPGC